MIASAEIGYCHLRDDRARLSIRIRDRRLEVLDFDLAAARAAEILTGVPDPELAVLESIAQLVQPSRAGAQERLERLLRETQWWLDGGTRYRRSRLVLALFAVGPPCQAQLTAARDPLTPAPALCYLARTGDFVVRQLIAGARHAPRAALEQLATNSEEMIRSEVAKNPRTPIELQRRLARDPVHRVRRVLAERAQLDPELEAILLRDPDPSVRRRMQATSSDREL